MTTAPKDIKYSEDRNDHHLAFTLKHLFEKDITFKDGTQVMPPPIVNIIRKYCFVSFYQRDFTCDENKNYLHTTLCSHCACAGFCRFSTTLESTGLHWQSQNQLQAETLGLGIQGVVRNLYGKAPGMSKEAVHNGVYVGKELKFILEPELNSGLYRLYFYSPDDKDFVSYGITDHPSDCKEKNCCGCVEVEKKNLASIGGVGKQVFEADDNTCCEDESKGLDEHDGKNRLQDVLCPFNYYGRSNPEKLTVDALCVSMAEGGKGGGTYRKLIESLIRNHQMYAR